MFVAEDICSHTWILNNSTLHPPPSNEFMIVIYNKMKGGCGCGLMNGGGRGRTRTRTRTHKKFNKKKCGKCGRFFLFGGNPPTIRGGFMSNRRKSNKHKTNKSTRRHSGGSFMIGDALV